MVTESKPRTLFLEVDISEEWVRQLEMSMALCGWIWVWVEGAWEDLPQGKSGETARLSVALLGTLRDPQRCVLRRKIPLATM